MSCPIALVHKRPVQALTRVYDRYRQKLNGPPKPWRPQAKQSPFTDRVGRKLRDNALP